MSSIITRLRPAVFFDHNRHDLDEINYVMFLWNLGLFDSNYLYNEIKEYNQVNSRSRLKMNNEFKNWLSAYRWEVFYNYDSVLKLKCAIIDLLVNQVSTHERATVECLKRGLPSDTATTYMEMLNDEHRWPEVKRRLRKKLTADGALQDFTLDPEEIRRQFDIDSKKYNVERNCNFEARNKLRFIADSNRLEVKDFARDILERCTGYYYRERPLKNRLHAINYAKAHISSRALQMIDYWTNPERARLVDGRAFGEDGVYTNRVKSLSDGDDVASLFNPSAEEGPAAFDQNVWSLAL